MTVPLVKDTRKAKGFAHVVFTFPEDAVRAMSELDGKTFQGRVLHVLPDRRKEEEASGMTSCSKCDRLLVATLIYSCAVRIKLNLKKTNTTNS